MNTNNERYFDIVNGPNKDTLFDACKYVCSKATIIPVDLAVAMGYTAPKGDPRSAYIPMAITDIKIIGIEHEDGSGTSFNLHGYCRADLESFGRTNVTCKPYKFKAYYNSKNRTGTITFEQ